MKRTFSSKKSLLIRLLICVDVILLLVGGEYKFLVFLAVTSAITFGVILLAAKQIKLKDAEMEELKKRPATGAY